MGRVRLKQPERVRLTEVTGAQVATYVGPLGTLTKPLPVSYATYRTLRKHPTVALARALVAAPVIAGGWSFESKDAATEQQMAFIQDNLKGHREELMEQAIYGGIDFGRQSFEQVFEIREGRTCLKRLKPLLIDLTTVLANKETGAFAGVRQQNYTTGTQVVVPDQQCLHIPFRVEGTNWNGESLLENARLTYTQWVACNLSASNYDRTVAGSHWAVYYPLGKTMFNGTETDNADVAQAVLTALESSGSVKLPRSVAEFLDQLASAASAESLQWKVEVLEDASGRQPTFVDRLKYLDALLVRALLMPERAILEGQFGTKAEAGEHADMALTNMELTDRYITRQVNVQVVDQLLFQNWGAAARGLIYIVSAPLVDMERAFLREIYKLMLTNQNGFADEFPTIDTDSLKDSLGVPKAQEVAPAGDDKESEEEEEPEEEPLEGVEAEKILAMARTFIPRIEDGRWTVDAAGLADRYGPELVTIDVTLRHAHTLAKEGKFSEARRNLFTVPDSVSDKRIRHAINHRVVQMLQRFLKLEQKALKAVGVQA